MSFFDSLSEVLVLLFAVAAGYAANKLKFLGGQVDKDITRLLMNFLMPIMVISSVLTSEELPAGKEIVFILLGSAVFYVECYLMAWLTPKILGVPREQSGVYEYSMAFPNMGFMGLPMASALYGPLAVIYVVVYIMPSAILCYISGPIMLGSKQRNKLSWKQFCTPTIIASVIALIMTLVRFRLPEKPTEAIAFVARIVIPLSLLLLGSVLANIPIRHLLGTPRLWLLTAFRLLVMPALVYVSLSLFGFEGLLLKVAVLLAAMPVGSNGVLFAMQYGGDSEMMAESTLISTVASIITIPLVVSLLG